MTARVLGTPGKERRRRLALLFPLLVVFGALVMLMAASGATAVNTNAGDYSTQDDPFRNDEPGQKDLTMQGVDTGDLPDYLNVLWNWDETSVGGGNTLDGCALFSTDTDDNIDFALCAVVGNVSNQDKTLELKTVVVYTCGDTRNDRCTQPLSSVSNLEAETDCELELNSDTNPFGDDPDTRIFCTIALIDVGGATNATLINTCSYPSQQPNSDPSDCVLVPGKANPMLATTPTLIPQDSATFTGLAGTSASVTFQLYKDDGDLVLCEAEELVFEETDTSSPYATNNDGTPSAGTKDGYTITTDGTYLWKVTFPGNADNNPAESACGTEQYVINLAPDPAPSS